MPKTGTYVEKVFLTPTSTQDPATVLSLTEKTRPLAHLLPHTLPEQKVYSLENEFFHELGDNSQRCHVDNRRTNESLYMVLYINKYKINIHIYIIWSIKTCLSFFVLFLEIWPGNLFATVLRVKVTGRFVSWHQRKDLQIMIMEVFQ